MLPCIFFLSLLHFVVGHSIIGVAPDKQDLYVPDEHGRWHCLSDPQIELSFDQINDDVCNCPDGSDEPGTNACPFSPESPKLFYCANDGFKPAYIENFKLNDGVCDYDVCCDGSDEYLSQKCPNLCGLVQEQFDEFMGKTRETLNDALVVKGKLEHKARLQKEKTEAQAASLREEVSELEQKLDQMRCELEKEQKAGAIDENDVTSALGLELDEYTVKLQKKFQEMHDYSATLSQVVDKLESIMDDMMNNYNPNFNDQAVKRAIASFSEHLTSKSETNTAPMMGIEDFRLDSFKEKLKEVASFDKTVSSSGLGAIYHKICDSYYRLIDSVGVVQIDKTVKPRQSRPASSKKEVELEERIKSVESSLKSKMAEFSIYNESLLQDYGEGDILRAVQGKWISSTLGGYTYRLGYLDALYQDDTLIGRFSGLDGQSMSYAEGSKCWNGPRRSAVVDMVCGPSHELISVSEPQKCEYAFVMTSPLACKQLDTEEMAQGFKVDQLKLKSGQ